MPYVYRVHRATPKETTVTVKSVPSTAGVVVATPVAEAPEPSYRDLQATAKELGVSAKQTKDDLKKAIEEAQSE